MKPISGKSRADAWLQAVRHLNVCDGEEDYNVVLCIEDPMRQSEGDRRIEQATDNFLRQSQALPLHSIAETIFPGSEYRRHGVEGVYNRYPDEIFPKIKSELTWGTYAHRILRRTGRNGETINPLEICVEKIKREMLIAGTKAACYELSTTEGAFDFPLYDAAVDRKRRRGGPCLSHMSLKVTRKRSLILTAVYRAHYYIERALGNLLGLARLQAFVCEQTNLTPGELVCVSTFAKLDTASEHWSKKQFESLYATLSGFVQSGSESNKPTSSMGA